MSAENPATKHSNSPSKPHYDATNNRLPKSDPASLLRFQRPRSPRDGLDRGGSPEGGRTRWTGEKGDELTLVAACRDVLRVISAQEGTKYDEELGPVIRETNDPSQPLGEVWTDELPAYQAMKHDHRTVCHDDRYVSEDGVHTNQAECLWSLLQPWLAKFRGLSKQDLEQAARTYGFVRSLNLTQAPIDGLIDCIAVNVFR